MRKNSIAQAQSETAATGGELLLTPADGARRCGCHATSIKRIALDLKITPLRTTNGLRIFTLPQIAKIAAELARRRKATLR